MMSIKKVSFLTNYNQYESKRHFTLKLAEALERAGISTQLIDAGEKSLSKQAIKEIYTFKPDFTASFSSFIPDESGAYLWDHLKIPHLSLLVDPSLYSLPLIQSPYSMISCVDAFDCFGLASQKFDRLLLLHHAVEAELEAEAEEEKEFDIVFFGSCYDYEAVKSYWQQRYPAQIGGALERGAELLLSHADMPLQEAFIKGWDGVQLEKKVDFLSLLRLVDSYSRGRDRVALIRAISCGQVHVFGALAEDEEQRENGWEHYLGGQSNVTLHPAVSFEEQLKILKKARLCLNSSPFFKDGSHERLLTGPAAHALVVTNNTLFSRREFVDGEEILLYDSSDPSAINAKIAPFLSDEKRRRAAVAAARKKVFSRHTWDQRAAQLQAEIPPLLSKMHN